VALAHAGAAISLYPASVDAGWAGVSDPRPTALAVLTRRTEGFRTACPLASRSPAAAGRRLPTPRSRKHLRLGLRKLSRARQPPPTTKTPID